ncbi:Gfo/Idh/MocA family oxidoreductase [Streptomyces sp. NPDC005283]|uniref:Gfo/Idh/MocA family protein n=1 Tax=Streptomyces sp. NPDC005283 TaxID=3156871 RepID=UPI003453CEEA
MTPLSVPGPHVPDRSCPMRVVLVGAGVMGWAWAHAAVRHERFELAAIVDADPRQARATALRLRRPDLPVSASLATLPDVGADVCINATPPHAHAAVISQAIDAGLATLTEKPFTLSLDQAAALADQAARAGLVLMVSQSRSYQPGLAAFRAAIGKLGGVHTLHARFSRGYPGTGFRAALDQPLLTDMAVHAFDAARLLTGSEATAVFCDTVERAGTGFQGAAEAAALFEMADGSRFHYTGTWCAPSLPTPWSGTWRAVGPAGTAEWDGAGRVHWRLAGTRDPEDAGSVDAEGIVEVADDRFDLDPVLQVSAPLDELAEALAGSGQHWGAAPNNLGTMAMLDAAVTSARLRSRVMVQVPPSTASAL